MSTTMRVRSSTDNFPELDADPAYLNGRPRIAGTRVSVAQVLGMLGSGRSVPDILASYPTLTEAGILACVRYAAEHLTTSVEYEFER